MQPQLFITPVSVESRIDHHSYRSTSVTGQGHPHARSSFCSATRAAPRQALTKADATGSVKGEYLPQIALF